MTTERPFFPADVQVYHEGEFADAQALFGVSRNLLFKADSMRRRPGAPSTVALQRRLPDGSSVRVLLSREIKLIYIVPGPKTKPEENPTAPPEPEFTSLPGHPGMLHGWIRTPTLITGLAGNVLRSFHPTDTCAEARHLLHAWQDNAQLATTPLQVATIKPSQYSGTMKRVVQAILGMGAVHDLTPSYFTGATPPSTLRSITVPYSYDFYTTHGIYKAAPKNHWLIEISKARGVLAMPLQLLISTTTTTPAFRAAAVSRGDVGTVAILDEFGGVPSGENFPATDALLTKALTEGKAIRLLEAADIAPFYGESGFLSNPYSDAFGWAFSDSGAEAHNTCWMIRGPDGKPHPSPYGADPTVRSVACDWWSLQFALTPHNVALIAQGLPVGSGTAALELRDRGTVSPISEGSIYSRMSFPYWVPKSTMGANPAFGTPRTGSSILQCVDFGVDWLAPGAFTKWDWCPSRNDPVYGDPPRWGATIHVFFDGDRLERLKWTPNFATGQSFSTELVAVYLAYEIGIGNVYYGSYLQHLSLRTMPAAFVGSSLDLRQYSAQSYQLAYTARGTPSTQPLVSYGDGGPGPDGQYHDLYLYAAAIPTGTREGYVVQRYERHFQGVCQSDTPLIFDGQVPDEMERPIGTKFTIRGFFGGLGVLAMGDGPPQRTRVASTRAHINTEDPDYAQPDITNTTPFRLYGASPKTIRFSAAVSAGADKSYWIHSRYFNADKPPITQEAYPWLYRDVPGDIGVVDPESVNWVGSV